MLSQLRRSRYAPIVRTRDAEMKGFAELSPSTLKKIVPIFELTRSRRSKKNPDGALEKTLEKMSVVTSDQTFVLDISTLESQKNSEIETLLDYKRNFSNWINFIATNFDEYCVPVIHYTDPFDAKAFQGQIERHLNTVDSFCVRVVSGSDDLLKKIIRAMEDAGIIGKCYLLLDSGYVSPRHIKPAALAAIRSLNLVSGSNVGCLSIASSSFPSSVVAPGYGDDDLGEFRLTEVMIHNAIKKRFRDLNWLYADYATIHPLEFQGTVTNWVPRVDVPLPDRLFYYRYRRKDGGYALAAKKAIRDPRYKPIDCWAHDNIVAAAEGSPIGKSPSHWIGVRLNMHVTRQVKMRN